MGGDRGLGAERDGREIALAHPGISCVNSQMIMDSSQSSLLAANHNRLVGDLIYLLGRISIPAEGIRLERREPPAGSDDHSG